MTFCLAWKTATTVFVISDSAVTELPSNREGSGIPYLTSFGEPQGGIGKHNKFITERALKLYTLERCFITFAGNANFGDEFISLLKQHLEVGRCIQESLILTISNYPEFSDKPAIQLLVASYESEPVIYTVENKVKIHQPYQVTNFIKKPEGLIKFGSPPEDLRKYTETFYNGFKKTWQEEVELTLEADVAFFMRMLALVQSYGIHNNTMELGIGGAYTGGFINSEEVNLQPDICYVMTGANPVLDKTQITFTKATKGQLSIVNTDGANIILNNLSNIEDPSKLQQESNLAMDLVLSTFDSGRFDYLVILNRDMNRHTATVIAMNRELHHRLISVDVNSTTPGTLGFAFSKKLYMLMNDNFEPIDMPRYAVIAYQGFMEVSSDFQNQIDETMPELRLEGIYDKDIDRYKAYIWEEQDNVQELYVSINSMIALAKVYSKASLIRFVDLQSDGVIMEFKDGKSTFPENGLEASFDQINDDIRYHSVFVYDCVSPNKSDKYGRFNIKAKSKADADAKVKEMILDLPEVSKIIDFVGIRFYHPFYDSF